MEIMIKILLVLILVIVLAIATVIACELGRLNKQINMVTDNVSRLEDLIIKFSGDIKRNQEKATIEVKNSIKDEVPKGLYKFMYPAHRTTEGYGR
jgi:predicted PurR-regulated permease PerM